MSKQKQKKTFFVHMFSSCSAHVLSLEFSCKYWTGNSMDNLLSYCGLVDARISTSDKDLSVPLKLFSNYKSPFRGKG